MSYAWYFILCLPLLFIGCAIRNDTAIFQTSISNTHVTPSATMSLEVHDHRSQKDIGSIKNSLGMKTGRILPKIPVSSILYESLTKACAAHAIAIAPSPIHLSVVINTCFAKCSTGILKTQAKALINLDLKLTHEEGTLLHQSNIQGEGIETPVLFYSGTNTEAALSKALQDTLEKLFQELLPYVTQAHHLTTDSDPTRTH